ncbi:hypothetical protein ACH42_17125 [Endozoicomonas sp. (ex Bugula neritina AB1)]|nr:hypothetical protein ACH42_17125 [Endozoicomonas sp. (ex Bugula neritina AB1)]
MAKTTEQKVADAFKTLLNRAEEIRVNDTKVTSGTASCVGKWSMTLKLQGGKEVKLEDKQLDQIKYDKGDFIIPMEDGKKVTRIAFFSMKKEIPRHI